MGDIERDEPMITDAKELLHVDPCEVKRDDDVTRGNDVMCDKLEPVDYDTVVGDLIDVVRSLELTINKHTSGESHSLCTIYSRYIMLLVADDMCFLY